MNQLYVPGWKYDPAEVARMLPAIAAAQGTSPFFGDHLAARAADDGRTVLLWEAETRLFGAAKPSWNQGQVGSCVSFGFGRSCNDLLLQMVATGKSGELPADVATEPIYGGSRVEVGGGRLGQDDGSLGAWAAEWVRRWGVLFRIQYGSQDLREYNESRCRQYGYRGVPDELEPTAKEHPVKTTALVRSAEEAWAALGSYYPVPVCSDQGFTTTLQGGFCQASGTWSHCMEIRGRVNSRQYGRAFVIQNSWADYLDGDNVIETADGQRIELPEGCFGARWEVVDRMLRQGDSFALSNGVGFPVRTELNWIF